jgi:bacillithiol system protein YtxJ
MGGPPLPIGDPVALRDRIETLTTPEQVDDFLRRHPDCAIFKVGSCHKTAETFRHVEAVLGPREELPLGLIRVLEARPASNHVAALTRIAHESPQLILFKAARPVFDRDNWDITPEDLAEALAEHFAQPSPA